MLRIVIPLVAFVAVVLSAPTTTFVKTIQPGAYQQYLVITPEAYPHLQSALKLEKQVLQPIPHQNVLLYHPNAPLLQYPLTQSAVRQNSFWDALMMWFEEQQPPMEAGEAPAGEAETPPAGGGEAPAKKLPSKQKLEFEADAEQIPLQPQTPASTTPLNGHRFYILSGQPQFYGNFDLLNQPGNPFVHYQPILAKARSIETGAEAIAEKPLANELAADQQAPLKNSPILLEVAAEVQPASSEPNLKQLVGEVEPLPPPFAAAEARFQSAYPAILNQPDEDSASLEGKNPNLKEVIPDKAHDDDKEKIVDDPSFARAGPAGIALAGRGGVASSKPVATALVEDGGVALASPSATSISGDFLEFDDRKQ